MDKLLSLFKVLGVPLLILNMFGGIVSGVWLAILGKWGAIGSGIAVMLVGSLLLGIVLMPGLIFAAPMAYFAERNFKIGAYFFGLLSSLYTVAVVTIWCVAILYYFTKMADSNSTIPILIWSFGVALGPWEWMAQKEIQQGEGFASVVATFFAQIGYLVMIIMVYFFRVTIMEVIIAFGGIMIVGLILLFITAMQIEQDTQRY